jgi:predicted RNA methylase
MEDDESRRETLIPDGICLAPSDAANCLLHTNRTLKFVRGLAAAVKEARKRNPGKRIKILYAGCGPYATLALPLTVIFKPTDVEFAVIDIHQESITNLEKLIEILGLKEYFSQIICQNALDFEPENDTRYDVLVTETMTAALFKEPQAAITTHLVKTLNPDGILVPEEIAVGVRLAAVNVLKKKRDRTKPHNVKLGEIFSLTKDTKAESFTPKLHAALAIPHDLDRNLTYAVIFDTRIRVFRENILEVGETLITKPVIAKIPAGMKIGSKLNISYRLGAASEDFNLNFSGD